MPEPRESFKTIFERGIKSVNTWDSAIKERYRAQIAGQYRQITDLYHHIFLMYVQEMYDQTLQDVTVRVNIPSLSTMLYTFIRLSCNHSSVCFGEYVTDMNFSARVLFVETILRRMLYELLVQQNNIRGIMTTKPSKGSKEVAPMMAPATVRQPVSAKAYSVMSEEDNVSQDLTLGATSTNKSLRPRRLSPTTVEDDTNRFWKAPETSMPPPFLLNPPKQMSPTGVLSIGSSSTTATTVSKQSSKHSSKHSSVAVSSQSPSVASKISKQSSQSTINNSTNSVSAPPLLMPTPEPVIVPVSAPTAAPVTKQANVTLSPAITPSVVKAMTADSRAADPIHTAPPPPPTEHAAPPHKPSAGLFDINSEFTPHKPWGKSLPEAQVTKGNRPDIEVDSLNLEKSEMSFQNELEQFFATQSQTITPYDSVTEIAAGNRRPPLFFPPNNNLNAL